MNFQTQYCEKLSSPEMVASLIQDGWVCSAHCATSIPTALLNALGRRAAADQVHDIALHAFIDLVPVEALQASAYPNILPVSWFSMKGFRACANEGRGDIMSAYFRDFPGLTEQYLEPDALLLAVAPMDRHGYFSIGGCGAAGDVLIRKAKRIYLEVNPNIPRVLSAPHVHISQVTALCEDASPLIIIPSAPIDDVSRAIGSYIAEEVPNGATIQLGVGSISETVGLSLTDKRDLGLHTELFTDSMVELIECGAVTNNCKPINRGKTVATLAYGSQRLYDYINDNPTFLIQPVNQVNDPAIIAQHPNFISINSAVEVDFFGQVCAESVGTRHLSGTGGQSDFVRGAIMSPGGKSFIAFPSTAQGGSVSKIKPFLTPGAIVSTSKNDVDHIVTEYGIAKLRGRTLSQRTKALISIAHPKFREELTYQAKKQNILI